MGYTSGCIHHPRNTLCPSCCDESPCFVSSTPQVCRFLSMERPGLQLLRARQFHCLHGGVDTILLRRVVRTGPWSHFSRHRLLHTLCHHSRICVRKTGTQLPVRKDRNVQCPSSVHHPNRHPCFLLHSHPKPLVDHPYRRPVWRCLWRTRLDCADHLLADFAESGSHRHQDGHGVRNSLHWCVDWDTDCRQFARCTLVSAPFAFSGTCAIVGALILTISRAYHGGWTVMHTL